MSLSRDKRTTFQNGMMMHSEYGRRGSFRIWLHCFDMHVAIVQELL